MSDIFQLTLQDDNTSLVSVCSEENPYLDNSIVEKLSTVISEINQQSHLHSVIFTGNDKYFSAGASLDGLINRKDNDLPHYVAEIPKLLLSIEIPTIAKMTGHAIGGGLALGLWCDFAYLSEESLYGANFMAIGFTPGMGSTHILEQAFGTPLAHEMIFTGKLLKGRTLKNHHVPLCYAISEKSDCTERVASLADELSEVPTQSLRLLKKTIAERKNAILRHITDQERVMHQQLFSNIETINRIKAQHWQSNDEGDINDSSTT